LDGLAHHLHYSLGLLLQAANMGAGKYKFFPDKKILTYPIVLDVKSRNATVSKTMGTWDLENGFKKSLNYEHKPIPRFFRCILNYLQKLQPLTIVTNVLSESAP
jgi:hypothetical protein